MDLPSAARLSGCPLAGAGRANIDCRGPGKEEEGQLKLGGVTVADTEGVGDGSQSINATA